MKYTGKLITIILIIQSFGVSAQKFKSNKLIGLWQVNTAQVADAMRANYRFFQDGTFRYSFASYDDRGRIREAKGTYKLVKDTLTIIIKSRKELVGGDLVAGSQGFQQDEMVLDGAKIIEVKQKALEPIRFTIKWLAKAGVKGVQIQNNKYFLVSNDPHNGED